jgi:hypothetical protein
MASEYPSFYDDRSLLVRVWNRFTDLFPGGDARRAAREKQMDERNPDRVRWREAVSRPRTGGGAPPAAPAAAEPSQPRPQTGSAPTAPESSQPPRPQTGSPPAQERPGTGDSPPSSGLTPPSSGAAPQPLIFGIEKGNQDTGQPPGTGTGAGGAMGGGFA